MADTHVVLLWAVVPSDGSTQVGRGMGPGLFRTVCVHFAGWLRARSSTCVHTTKGKGKVESVAGATHTFMVGVHPDTWSIDRDASVNINTRQVTFRITSSGAASSQPGSPSSSES